MDHWTRLLGSEPLLRPSEAARRLGLSPRTLENWRLAGHVAFRRIGRIVWIEVESLSAYLRSREERIAADGELLSAIRAGYRQSNGKAATRG